MTRVTEDGGWLILRQNCPENERNKTMRYFRVHTADVAYVTRQPRGLFTAIWKLVDAKLLTEEEEKTYWENRAYFERVLPVPPFYAQGNPDRAVTWFKENDAGRRIWQEMTFYREMAKKYGLKLYLSTCEETPGEIIYEDECQIAVKGQKCAADVAVREL